MKRNFTALIILLVVQLVLWKVVPNLRVSIPISSSTKKLIKHSKVPYTLKTTLKGHALKVTSVAITADNNRVISELS